MQSNCQSDRTALMPNRSVIHERSTGQLWSAAMLMIASRRGTFSLGVFGGKLLRSMRPTTTVPSATASRTMMAVVTSLKRAA